MTDKALVATFSAFSGLVVLALLMGSQRGAMAIAVALVAVLSVEAWRA
jgi:hypothetical protein